ncbi:hypothetical protein UFOVP629_19 [uncultured Caudovirales phage]|uniref:Uncharacterized protein n=1 Tax=uncultured Caudovirales phage TaxID=2100421 RepID=A0A6J5NB43_9CAUD|nr:hypothetical protein UFOVP629_19 [uncultured Caudovirales phage]
MLFLICSLAVYKAVQTIDALLPKEPMPWVKLLASIALGYAASAICRLDNLTISGLAVTAVAGGVHTLLRLLTLAGDLAQRKNLR